LPHRAEGAPVVLIPIPWEPTTSYGRGTVNGPKAILEASRQVDLFDIQTGRPYEAGIAMLPIEGDVEMWNEQACLLSQPVIEAGGAGDDAELQENLAAVNALSRQLTERVEAIAEEWLGKGKLVGLVGGDHSSPLGLIRALAKRHPGMGVLHVDAHADLRDAYEGFEESHASIMFNVHAIPEVAKIVQVAIRDLSEEEHRLATESPRIEAFFDAHIADRTFRGEPFALILADIVRALPHEVYVSFDIDGLDPAFCPGTGTPVPGGLGFREACALLSAVVESGRRIIGFDLCEVAGAEWDANVGARMLYKLIGFALKSVAATGSDAEDAASLA
jgi:agmatinase